MDFRGILILAWSSAAALAADLTVTEKDLPRIPPSEPAHAIATFSVRPGFRVEIVAAEPLIADPVAMAFDENGRLFVAEMRDYSERREEHLGRIRLLEDNDGDGRFDKATTFAENLPWPTAIICFDGGVFIGASPDILFCRDTDGDGIADVRNKVFTGFGSGAPRLNVQQLLNSFTWGLDNRIHGALGGNASTVTNLMRAGSPPLALRGRDFSFNPRTFDLRAESGGGQWGIGFDDEGNKFTCSNSRHLVAEMYEDRYARNPMYPLPPPDVDIAVDGPAAEIFRTSPVEPWRVLRTQWRVAGMVPGPIEGGGRASGYFSGASGVTIYRGDAFPPGFRGDAFVADCGSNLIHRKKVRRDGLRFLAERAADEQQIEFLASKDNWFRPVSLANAPDGTLHVIDMYREVVEHPWSLPEQIKSKLDLNSGNDRGRIYRIVPNDFKPRPPVRIGSLSLLDLVQVMEHQNGWHRDTAARLLIEKNDPQSIPALRNLIRTSKSSETRLQTLHLLGTLERLTPEDIRVAWRDPAPAVRRQALILSEPAPASSTPFPSALQVERQALVNDPEPTIRYQALWTIGRDLAPRDLVDAVRRDASNSWMRVALLSAASHHAPDVFTDSRLAAPDFLSGPGVEPFLRELARIVGTHYRDDVRRALQAVLQHPDRFALATALEAGLQRHRSTLQDIDPVATERLIEEARRTTASPAAGEPVRIAAIQFLGAHPAAVPALRPLLTGETTERLQLAALTAMLLSGDTREVIARWRALLPTVRTRAVSLLLARDAGVRVLLDAIEAGSIARDDLAASDVQRLLETRDSGTRSRAEKLFRNNGGSIATVLKQFQSALALKGERTPGHEIYAERCASCHRAGKEGHAVGPDLSSIAASGKEKLLASIIDPNAEVAAAFLACTIETVDGDTLVGILAGENPLAVTLKMPNGETARLLRENINSMQTSMRSLMPEGLEAGLTAQEMAHLLEFISSAEPSP